MSLRGRGFLRALPGEGLATPCAWSLQEDALTFSPEGSTPFVLALRECSGVEGDEHALALRAGGTRWELAKLGAGGPTLVDALRRAWPALRAEALRLTGRGEGKLHPAHVAREGASPAPGCLLAFDDLLLAAPWGEDLSPLFLSLSERVETDEEAWGLTVLERGGGRLTLSRLGPKRDVIARTIGRAREGLARVAHSLLSAALPSLSAAEKAALSGVWLPGRLCSEAALSSLAPATLPALWGWIGGLPRKDEAAALKSGAGPEDTFFALLPGESRRAAPAGSPEEDAGTDPPAPEEGPVLWMAVRRGDRWFLEALSEGDRATYAFEGGPELLGLLSMLLCAPQFSREALYLPIEKLTGDRAPLACAARDLPFLQELRSRLKARAVHCGPDSWRGSLAL